MCKCKYKRTYLKTLKLKIKKGHRFIGKTLYDKLTEHEWDIIKVNKKSIIVQCWPTYEQRKVML